MADYKKWIKTGKILIEDFRDTQIKCFEAAEIIILDFLN